jgi:hypothetical protein
VNVPACAATPRDLERLNAVAEELPEVASVAGWPMLASLAGAFLVVAGDLDDAVVYELRFLREREPAVPIVLATSLTTDNLLRLATVTVDRVVDIRGGAADWREAIAVAVTDAAPTGQRELVARLRQATHLPAWLRVGAIRLATAAPPIRSVKALARSLGCSASTLRTHFGRLPSPPRLESGGRAESRWRLEDLVDWFVLLYYGWPRRAERNTARAAAAATPTKRTLDHMARRLLGTGRESIPRPAPSDHPLIARLLSTPE